MYTYLQIQKTTMTDFITLTGSRKHFDIFFDILMNISTYDLSNSEKYQFCLRCYNSHRPFNSSRFATHINAARKTVDRAFDHFVATGILCIIIIDGEKYYKLVNPETWLHTHKSAKKESVQTASMNINTSQLEKLLLAENVNNDLVKSWLSLDESSLIHINEIVTECVQMATQGKIENLGAYIRKTIEQNIDNLANWKQKKISTDNKTSNLAKYEKKFSKDEPLF